jgi:hypothetical protein
VSSSKTVIHAPATTQPVQVSGSAGQSVTVTSAPANTGRIWMGVNPLVAIYPWYGTALLPGTSITINTVPGQTVYTRSGEPASLTVTVS